MASRICTSRRVPYIISFLIEFEPFVSLSLALVRRIITDLSVDTTELQLLLACWRKDVQFVSVSTV